MFKWLSMQASSGCNGADTMEKVFEEHPAYNINNPNSNYSLLGGFCGNLSQFPHARGIRVGRKDGEEARHHQPAGGEPILQGIRAVQAVRADASSAHERLPRGAQQD